jgi:protein-S-isoprenylcysteine O-methyltransferase Ste14
MNMACIRPVRKGGNLRINLKSMAVQAGIVLIVYALPIFLPGGLRAWPAGWIFLIIWFGFWLVELAWLLKHNPALFQERMRVSAADQKGWDRIFPLLINLTLFAWLLYISFDVLRWHWSPVPVWLQIGGAIIMVCSFALFFLTFRENSFLSPVVRLQAERGQTVISTGPYQYVRHPMYAAMGLVVISAPQLLGAWYGTLMGFIFMLVLARRSVLEERSLRQELPGYTAYMERVKFRLVPYIW